MQLGDWYVSGQAVTASAVALAFAALAFWAFVLAIGEPEREGRVGPAEGAGEPLEMPLRPSEPAAWVTLVNTNWDGRLSDQDLLYLEAVLHDEGIAAEFGPYRPGRHYLGGSIAGQYPLSLLVDAEKVDDALAIRNDFLGDEWQGFQPRLANVYANIPGQRDGMFFIGAALLIVHGAPAPAWKRVVAWVYVGFYVVEIGGAVVAALWQLLQLLLVH